MIRYLIFATLLFGGLMSCYSCSDDKDIKITFENSSYITDTLIVHVVVNNRLYDSVQVINKSLQHWEEIVFHFPDTFTDVTFEFQCRFLDVSDKCIVQIDSISDHSLIIVNVEEYLLNEEDHGVKDTVVKRINCNVRYKP